MIDITGIDDALEVASQRITRLVTEHPDQVPVYTSLGRWVFDDDPWAPAWTSGFLTGQLWIAAEHTGNDHLRSLAEHYSLLLEQRKKDGTTHDIGFIFEPSWGRWHDIEASSRTREVLIQSGRTMANRYNSNGHYLSTWVDEGSTFIDVMMNIGIIFRAAELSGDPRLSEIAIGHALTSRRFLVRGDGSSIHEGWFDPNTGEFLRAATHQGHRSDSCWARGQAWGIYGFTTAYRHTKDSRFLETAQLLADFYIDHTREAYVPPNDWDDLHPTLQYEASAGCVAASAFLQLAEVLSDNCESKLGTGNMLSAEQYAQYGAGIVSRLSSPEFSSNSTNEWEGIIQHATYHNRDGLGIDESVMWGDYYYVEALWRLRSSAYLCHLAGLSGAREASLAQAHGHPSNF